MKKFSEFTKINENISSLVYKPSSSFEDKRLINRAIELFDMSEDIKLKNPPANNSDETRAELSEIADQMEYLSESNQTSSTVFESFLSFCSSVGLEVDYAKLLQMIKESRSIIRELQYQFNRPRPEQIAKSLGIKLPRLLTERPTTPSYPSEKSSQSYMVSSYLGHLFSGHEQDFLNIAESLGMSQISSGSQFMSGHEAGRQVGLELFIRLKDKS